MFGPLQQLVDDPVRFGLFLLAFLFSISVHESSHAVIAYQLGDPTGKMLGRITLNPLKHLELMGSLMFLFVGFGWARPVPVNPMNLRGNPRTGMALVSAAGPLSNLALASAAAGLLSFPLAMPPEAMSFLRYVVFLNVLLAIFNLIPLAPLDGFKVVLGLLPRPMAFNFGQLEAWGPGILFTLIALSYFTGFNVFSMFLFPIVQRISQILLSGRLF